MSDIDLLRKTHLFAGLSDGQLKALRAQGQTVETTADEIIFEEGTSGQEVYVLLAGRVQISVEMSRKTEQAPVHTVVPGSVFGEFALAQDVGRSATAVALKDSQCFVFTRGAIQKLAEKDPTLGYRVMCNLSEILIGRITKTTRELRASLMF